MGWCLSPRLSPALLLKHMSMWTETQTGCPVMSPSTYFWQNLNKYPQFTFIPKQAQLWGLLLTRLANCMVVQDPYGCYRLDHDILKSWFWLEDTLAATIAALSHQLSFPLTVNIFTYLRKDVKYAWVQNQTLCNPMHTPCATVFPCYDQPFFYGFLLLGQVALPSHQHSQVQLPPQ